METLRHAEHQISALNDLIRINNDRITGYKKRMDIMLDNDLEDLFFQFIYQSKQNVDELTKYIYLLGGKPADRKSLSGKFYHAWMDFTSTVVEQCRQTLLDYCEYSEDVAKSAYNKVLNDKELLWEDKKVNHLLNRQLADLKMSHKLIKTLRDESAAAA
ncbi:MAG: family four-helix-bundle protein [Mucilaginibacter sp.]|nr:family four-helix-bundle protein [Mucilaginibacter sp.]